MLNKTHFEQMIRLCYDNHENQMYMNLDAFQTETGEKLTWPETELQFADRINTILHDFPSIPILQNDKLVYVRVRVTYFKPNIYWGLFKDNNGYFFPIKQAKTLETLYDKVCFFCGNQATETFNDYFVCDSHIKGAK